jgi:Carboxypeptidase regulatory-like domain
VTITAIVLAIAVVVLNVYIACNNDGILRGRVVDMAGVPVAGSTVTLFKPAVLGVEPVADTRSGADGTFSFKAHGQHRPVLQARKEGVGDSGQLQVRLYFRNQNRVLISPLRLR